MPELNIEAKQLADGIVQIEANGTLTGETSEKMEGAIQALFNRGCYKLVVNMTKIQYISSAGAGVFIGQVGTAEDNKGHIFLMLESDSLVFGVFDVLGLLDIFPHGPTMEDGVKYFQSR